MQQPNRDLCTNTHGHHINYSGGDVDLLADTAPGPDELVAAADDLGVSAMDLAGALLDDDSDADLCLRSSNPAALEAVSALLRWVWGKQGSPAARVRAAFVKFVGVSLIVRPDCLGGASMEEVGRSIGITRQAISLAHIDASDKLGMRNPAGRTTEARESYSRSATKAWERRRAGNNGRKA